MYHSNTCFINANDYDFIDFGASKGGCIDFALKKLGGTRGVGIDIDPKKVLTMLEHGYDCIQGDVTQLNFPPNSVRFVPMSHVLEHLPDLQTVAKALKSVADVASDFLFIQGPYFDADDYLKNLGLKFFWSDWHGHKCHLTTEQLRRILLNLGLNDFVIMARVIVKNSSDPAIHPLSSPIDQHDYNNEIHPEKPFVSFEKKLYKEMVCYVKLRQLKNWKKIIKARNGC